MAVPAGVKLDDGSGGYFTNCFPARNIFRPSEDAGAWMVAQKAEQRRHFKAVLCAKPKTYAQLKHERRQREKEERRRRRTPSSPDAFEDAGATTPGLMDGFFLLKHCCVEDPADVCSINVAGKELTDVKEEDYQLFDNAAYINAGENLLPFEAFNHFPIVRELELPLNALRGIRVDLNDFPCLEVLDLSYNNLSKEDVLVLGLLPRLKVLYLTGNQLRSLPVELAKPYKVSLQDGKETSVPRFPSLELFSLDDNHLTDLATFASLAGLRRLRQLNLDKNDVASVPHLRALSGKHVAVESEPPSAGSTPSGRRSRRRSAKSRSGSRAGLASPGVTAWDLDGRDAVQLEQHLAEVKEDLPPPFPELEHLSLAFNKIGDEESLLAVAAWPMLKELVIHDNPLTTNSSGDLPLLKRYLTDRLGISMARRKPDGKPKPAIQVAAKPHRKVAEVVPPIPKKPLQLRLESAHAAKALTTSPSQPTPPPTMGKAQRSTPGPLPPIPATPEERPKTHPLQHGESGDAEPEEEKPTRTQSWTAESFPGSQPPKEKVQQADEPVFLTQVDDPNKDTEPKEVPPKQQSEKHPEKMERVDSAAFSMSVPEKYKGYEIFYDVPEDPEEEPIVTDIQGNLRSLRLALKHPTLYQNQVDLEKLQKPFEPYKQSKFQPRPPHKSKAEKLEDILATMKDRLVIEEVNLGKLLEDRKMLKEEYPEVIHLLQEIQAKYSAVRAGSMHDGQSQQNAASDTLKALQGLSQQRSPHEGARPKSGRKTRVSATSALKS